jgi:hypothetical protein
MINQIKHLTDKLYLVRYTHEFASDVLKIVKIRFSEPSLSAKVVKALDADKHLHYL